MVGTSAAGLLDIRATPTEDNMPGVEVHAQLIEAALSGAFLLRPNFIDAAELALIMFGGLLMVWLVPKIGAKWTMILFFVVAGSSAGSSWYLFAEKRILFDAGYAIVSILLLYTLLTYTGYAKEEAQRRPVGDQQYGQEQDDEEGNRRPVDLEHRAIEAVAGDEEIHPHRRSDVADLHIGQEYDPQMHRVYSIANGNGQNDRNDDHQG